MSRDEEYVSVPRSTLDKLTELLSGSHEHDERVREAGIREGRAAVTRDGYQAGHDLGHDVGYGARPEAQGFVNGILDGLAAGNADRRELADHLLRETMPARSRPERQVSGQWAQRPAAAREAEAWGGRGPSGSYAEWVAEGREPEPELEREREAG